MEDKEAGLGKRKGTAAFVTTFVQMRVWPWLLGITWPCRAATNLGTALCSACVRWILIMISLFIELRFYSLGESDLKRHVS